jgi:hypothetical protein
VVALLEEPDTEFGEVPGTGAPMVADTAEVAE